MRNLALQFLCFVLASLSASAAKPNIIVILADDLGYGDVSYHGTLKETTTPHIDSIAQIIFMWIQEKILIMTLFLI